MARLFGRRPRIRGPRATQNEFQQIADDYVAQKEAEGSDTAQAAAHKAARANRLIYNYKAGNYREKGTNPGQR